MCLTYTTKPSALGLIFEHGNLHPAPHLLRGERRAQGANGLGVFRRFLFELQQLRRLDQGLQSLCRSALLQVLPVQPFLQLADVKPGRAAKVRCEMREKR